MNGTEPLSLSYSQPSVELTATAHVKGIGNSSNSSNRSAAAAAATAAALVSATERKATAVAVASTAAVIDKISTSKIKAAVTVTPNDSRENKKRSVPTSDVFTSQFSTRMSGSNSVSDRYNIDPRKETVLPKAKKFKSNLLNGLEKEKKFDIASFRRETATTSHNSSAYVDVGRNNYDNYSQIDSYRGSAFNGCGGGSGRNSTGSSTSTYNNNSNSKGSSDSGSSNSHLLPRHSSGR